MPFLNRINTMAGLSATEKQQLIAEFTALRAELDDIRTKFVTLLAKLDDDATVTDTNYEATCAPATATFTRT